MAIRSENPFPGRREASERVVQAVGAERMHDSTLFEDRPESSTNDPAREMRVVAGWADVARHQVRRLADLVASEVQEHPVRSMLLASAVGYLVAMSMRSRVIPALLRSGAGIAAAMVMREIAERGFDRLDSGAGRGM